MGHLWWKDNSLLGRNALDLYFSSFTKINGFKGNTFFKLVAVVEGNIGEYITQC